MPRGAGRRTAAAGAAPMRASASSGSAPIAQASWRAVPRPRVSSPSATLPRSIASMRSCAMRVRAATKQRDRPRSRRCSASHGPKAFGSG
jgi:hypothetical protein